MARHIERRAGGRALFKSPVKVKNLETGAFSNARMVNYCDHGLYLESNRVLDVGAEIFLGIENSPYTNGSDMFDVYRAKILWRKAVESTFYKFGYGVQLMSAQAGDHMRVNAEADLRKYSRMNCNQSVCFSSKDQQHQGVVKNICPRGLFIETHATLSVGQTIEMTLPDRKTGKPKLLSGEIVRSDPAGIGIRLKRIFDTNSENSI